MSTTRLDTFLFEQGYYESRARATSAVKAGKVILNGRVVTKPSSKVPAGAKIDAQKEHPWVSRGGMKLDHALDVFAVGVAERTALDIGSSTGGFTDVLLSRKAAKIYAVDVGREQLHRKLRGHPKVISMESTDARKITPDLFEPLPTLIVCDASFISAMKVLERPMSLLASGADLVTLVKPQFEVGKDNIARGGLVKDPALAIEALKRVSDWVATQGWTVLGTVTSSIKGGDGNTEYLLYARKK